LGHKVHPTGFRIGVILDWQAKWYADVHYAESLHEDLKLRQAIATKYADAAVSLVQIERQAKEVSVTVHTARPGIVIGRGGQRVDELRLHLEQLIGKRVRLNIQEIRQPELDANLVAKTIAEQIQRRIAYRRAMKQAIFRTIQAGAKGIRVSCAGRLGDAEIARRQTMHQGQVPLHTLRADIDYGFTEARTTLGRIGVKVWIYKGEILPELKIMEVEEIPAELAAVKEAEAELAIATEEIEKPAGRKQSLPNQRRSQLSRLPLKVPRQYRKQNRRKNQPKPSGSGRKQSLPSQRRSWLSQLPLKVPRQHRKQNRRKNQRVRKKAVAAEPEEKPAEPVAVEGDEVAPEAKPEEKPTKPKRVRKKAVAAEPAEDTSQSAVDTDMKAEASTTEEQEEKDATT